jgi:uncharacterized iron-regulated protein
MNKKFSYLFLVLFVFLAFKSDKPAYKIYDIQGRESDYSQLLKKAKEADVVLFGELHDNPICHWLQLELTKDLFADKKNKEKFRIKHLKMK